MLQEKEDITSIVVEGKKEAKSVDQVPDFHLLEPSIQDLLRAFNLPMNDIIEQRAIEAINEQKAKIRAAAIGKWLALEGQNIQKGDIVQFSEEDVTAMLPMLFQTEQVKESYKLVQSCWNATKNGISDNYPALNATEESNSRYVHGTIPSYVDKVLKAIMSLGDNFIDNSSNIVDQEDTAANDSASSAASAVRGEWCTLLKDFDEAINLGQISFRPDYVFTAHYEGRLAFSNLLFVLELIPTIQDDRRNENYFMNDGIAQCTKRLITLLLEAKDGCICGIAAVTNGFNIVFVRVSLNEDEKEKFANPFVASRSPVYQLAVSTKEWKFEPQMRSKPNSSTGDNSNHSSSNNANKSSRRGSNVSKLSYTDIPHFHGVPELSGIPHGFVAPVMILYATKTLSEFVKKTTNNKTLPWRDFTVETHKLVVVEEDDDTKEGYVNHELLPANEADYRFIASGGFADIYAIDPLFLTATTDEQKGENDQSICLKLIRNKRDIETLCVEYKALKALSNHKNIIQLYGMVQNKSSEAIDALLLRPVGVCIEKMRDFPFDITVFVEEMTSALLAVHSKHMCHCDVRPSNIIFSANTFVLIDWGLSTEIGTCRSGEFGVASYLRDDIVDSIANRQNYKVASCHDLAGLAFTAIVLQQKNECQWYHLRNRPTELKTERTMFVNSWKDNHPEFSKVIEQLFDPDALSLSTLKI